MVIINLGARFIVNELNEDQRNMINSKYLNKKFNIFSNIYGN